ncbi:MAG: D-tyrosyl-tRNA(Tyr) deacylase [Bifidobacteriaceae bacterium]|nr:D-tyrosyl-tRNA(Tyr) deacylase [Bifidobacteriaceae bacterium]
MRAVIQRVTQAQCTTDGRELASLTGEGLVVLVAAGRGDTPSQAETLARKIAELKLLRGDRSVQEAAAPVLLISQFTLYGDTRKGRKPSWSKAAPGAEAEPLVERVALELEGRGLVVGRGQFGADMRVSLTNDGPVTLIVET